MWKKLKSSMICWGNNMNDKRVGYFDILRIVSIFFVIVIHVTSVGLRLCETATPTWNVNWLLNSVSRWAVPVFFMVSGALFLEPSREITLKKLYKKSIFHIVVCIIVWGFFTRYWTNTFMERFLLKAFRSPCMESLPGILVIICGFCIRWSCFISPCLSSG